MRNLTRSTLLAIVLGLFASQASAVELVFYQPHDNIYLLPGQIAWGEMFVNTDLGDEAVFMSMTYNTNFYVNGSAELYESIPGCGVSVPTHAENHYGMYWQDYGHLCGITGFHLNTWNYVNHMPPGDQGSMTGQCLATLVAADTSDFWAEYVARGFQVGIVSYDAIRGDITGVAEDGNAFSWRDIDIADSIWRIGDNLGNLYTVVGDNLARSSSYWSYPTAGDVSLMALAMSQPTHPYVRSIHYGELFSTPRNGITSVPATPDLVGQTLYISTNGSMVMAMATLPDGSIWAQSGPTQGGVATFTNVPEGITADRLIVEAITLDGVSEVDPFQLPALPSQVELGQNYPNPFNPSTTVPFTLQVPARVTLTVYDQLGRQVATLAQGPYQAGRHEVNFNAADLPTGMYFAQLKAGHATSTKKMLLIK